MQGLLDWYFEKCKMSTVLIVGAVAWVTSACLMLGGFAPAVYLGLHLVTTGLFSFAILRVRDSVSQ
jgi:hypothetical protein